MSLPLTPREWEAIVDITEALEGVPPDRQAAILMAVIEREDAPAEWMLTPPPPQGDRLLTPP